MKAIRILTALGLALGLSACGGSDLASRNAPYNTDAPVATAAPATSEVALTANTAQRRVVLAPQYNVVAINIMVPYDLKVSEANSYYPLADIVWRGEPLGDRHQQVRAIFTEAFGLGTGHMKSGPQVLVEAKVERFHSLTEKTRYSFGGMHSLRFELTVRDATTNAVIEGPRTVIADIKASGGTQAIAEDQAGRTQRVVIIEQLRAVIRRELSLQREEAPVSRSSMQIPLTPERMMQQSPIPL